MWSVVHFNQDNSVEVVPSKWVTKYKCAWPINKTKKCIEGQIDPNNNTFNWFKSRTLLSNIESYSEALEKCKKAIFTSDLSSTEDDTMKISKEKLNVKKKILNQDKTGILDEETDESDANFDMPNYESDNSTRTTICNLPKKKIKKLVPLKPDILTSKNSYDPNSSPSLLEKFSYQHLPDSVKSSSKQVSAGIKPHKKVSYTQPFYSTVSPSKQASSNMKSPKKSLSFQKSISFKTTDDETTPTKTPSKISFSVNVINSPNPLSSHTLNGKQSESPPEKCTINTPNKTLSPHTFHSSELSQRKPHVNLSKMSGNLIRKQLFNPKLSGSHSAANMKTSCTVPTISKSTNNLTDNQFKDMVSHNLIIIKHSIRNLGEKLDLLIEKNSKLSQNSNFSEGANDDIDYTNLNCLFPIDDISTLNNIEEQLASDKKYYNILKNKLIGLGGKTLQIHIRRVMQFLFTDELLKWYSFNGRGNKKKCFSNLMISKLIFESIKMLKKFNYENATDDIEKYVKNALIQAPFNIKKKLPAISVCN